MNDDEDMELLWDVQPQFMAVGIQVHVNFQPVQHATDGIYNQSDSIGDDVSQSQSHAFDDRIQIQPELALQRQLSPEILHVKNVMEMVAGNKPEIVHRAAAVADSLDPTSDVDVDKSGGPDNTDMGEEADIGKDIPEDVFQTAEIPSLTIPRYTGFSTDSSSQTLPDIMSYKFKMSFQGHISMIWQLNVTTSVLTSGMNQRRTYAEK